jgi:hypothetical protein
MVQRRRLPSPIAVRANCGGLRVALALLARTEPSRQSRLEQAREAERADRAGPQRQLDTWKKA